MSTPGQNQQEGGEPLVNVIPGAGARNESSGLGRIISALFEKAREFREARRAKERARAWAEREGFDQRGQRQLGREAVAAARTHAGEERHERVASGQERTLAGVGQVPIRDQTTGKYTAAQRAAVLPPGRNPSQSASKTV